MNESIERKITGFMTCFSVQPLCPYFSTCVSYSQYLDIEHTLRERDREREINCALD